MTSYEERHRESQKEIAETKERFEASYGSDSFAGPFRDDGYIADAIKIFWLHAYEEPAGRQPKIWFKAAQAIATRLMAMPDMKKEWRVSFPYVFMDKENTYTDAEIKRRNIAWKVKDKVEAGARVTHAIAEVAASIKKSPQKVTKDYYEWLPVLEAFDKQRAATLDEYSKLFKEEKNNPEADEAEQTAKRNYK